MRGALGLGVFVAGWRLAAVAGLALALALLLFGCCGGSASAAAAAATPAAGWAIESFAGPSVFSAGDSARCAEALRLCDSYVVSARDAGSLPTDGEPVRLTDALPKGLELEQVSFFSETPGQEREELDSDCASVPLVCRFAGVVRPDQTLRMIVYVRVVEGGVDGTESLRNVATVSGGGAAAASASTETAVGTAAPPFGAASFDADVAGVDGLADTQAGGHPYELTAAIDLNSAFREGPEGKFVDTSVQDVKDVVIDLPLGFLASALATPTCTFVQLSAPGDGCPPDTAVGRIRTEPEGNVSLNGEIYNMTPKRGVPAELGYADGLAGSHALYVSVAPTPAGYVLRVTATDVPQLDLTNLTVTLFGDPAEKDGNAGAPLALLTNPSVCSGQPLVTSLHLDSWQHPGSYEADGTPDFGDSAWVSASSQSSPVAGCDALRFDPELSAQPTTNAADSPTGLELGLRSPASEAPETLATPPLKEAAIALPEGLTIDPAAGNGLQACSEAQVGWLGPNGPSGEPLPNRGLTNFSAQEPACPEQSEVGSFELTTPLFAAVLSGTVYLAAQDENPFASALAAYLVVEDPATGVVLKLPAELRADPRTGRLTLVLPESPQLPLGDLELHFFKGPRALLANPNGCGAYATTSDLTPWSTFPGGTPSLESSPTQPAAAESPSDGFTIDEGCVGGFAPGFVAGSTNLQAGVHTPFEASFSRADSDQELSDWSVSLPPGLLADVGSVPLCPAAAANAGTCPEASRVGTVLVGAGPGPSPLFETGRAYLTGPYNGGPFGLSVVVPVIAGPLNLGTIVVRQSLRIGGGRAPDNAQITDVSDPFPTVLDVTGSNGQTDGIPIRLRRVDIVFERAGGAPFMFNPTSCAKLPLTGDISSSQGARAAVSSPFQVKDCADLKFAPKLAAVTRANGELAGHGASLRLTITTGAPYTTTSPSGSSSTSASTSASASASASTAMAQANIRSLKLDLPQRLPARLETIQRACPEKTFAQNPATCPRASVVGQASVQTPILAGAGGALSGPAYLVSKSGTGATVSGNGAIHPAGESKTEREEAAFPDLVLVLQGDGVRIDLTGALFVSAQNITSVAFRSIPDVPIRRLDLTLPEGKTSILAASAGLCTKRPLRMTTAIAAQNGARLKPEVTVGVMGCPPTRRKPKKAKRHARRHKR